MRYVLDVQMKEWGDKKTTFKICLSFFFENFKWFSTLCVIIKLPTKMLLFTMHLYGFLLFLKRHVIFETFHYLSYWSQFLFNLEFNRPIHSNIYLCPSFPKKKTKETSTKQKGLWVFVMCVYVNDGYSSLNNDFFVCLTLDQSRPWNNIWKIWIKYWREQNLHEKQKV